MTPEDRALLIVCTASIIAVVVFTNEWLRVTMAVLWILAAILIMAGSVANEIAEYHRKGKNGVSASRRLHEACAAQMQENAESLKGDSP